MQEKDFIKLLQSFKDEPELGGGFDFKKSWQRFAKEYGFNQEIRETTYTWRDYLETYLWQFTHSMLRPLGAAVAVFVFAITGWVSIANASMGAIPGDQLYGVKLSIERAQLVLAFGANQRANLQVEFASRRLAEMVELSATKQQTPETVHLAVERFKSEVTTINEELKEESETQNKQKKELAKAVGRQAAVYSSTVASTSNELSPEVRVEVEEIIEAAKDQAVEVIITAHEADQDEETARELAYALEEEVKRVQAEFGDLANLSVETALALQAEGNYRRAFQVLKEFELSSQDSLK